MSDHLKNLGTITQTIHAGAERDPATRSVVAPIYQTSTFAFDDTAQGAALFKGEEEGFVYTRMGNPTVRRLEEAVAILEKGAGAIAVSSGMAALNTLLFALLGQGDHVIGTHSVYGPSRVVIERDWARFGVKGTFVDTSDVAQVKNALTPQTKMIIIETPTNPTMLLTDIREIADLARQCGAYLVVDNTFASPILQRPLELGADIVFHSMTKFLNGHSDVVAGIVVFAASDLMNKVLPVHKYLGACIDPHQSWLILRGVRTLSLRVKAAQKNALHVARFLDQHPKVAAVFYPGLDSYPQLKLAQEQMDGPGSLIAFELKGGYEAGATLLNNVKVMTLAVSLGGVETLIQHPASMTHAAMKREERLQAGITDGLVRLSVGCEDREDLIADLDQALAKV
jgi:methionine-gamma-lyase